MCGISLWFVFRISTVAHTLKITHNKIITKIQIGSWVHVSANEFQKRSHTARLFQASCHWFSRLVWKNEEVTWQIKKIILDGSLGSSWTMMSKSSFPLPLALLCNEVWSEVRWKAAGSHCCTDETVAILSQCFHNIYLFLFSPVQLALKWVVSCVQVQV